MKIRKPIVSIATCYLTVEAMAALSISSAFRTKSCWWFELLVSHSCILFWKLLKVVVLPTVILYHWVPPNPEESNWISVTFALVETGKGSLTVPEIPRRLAENVGLIPQFNYFLPCPSPILHPLSPILPQILIPRAVTFCRKKKHSLDTAAAITAAQK